MLDAPELFGSSRKLRHGGQLKVGSGSQSTIGAGDDNLVVRATQIASRLRDGRDGPVLVRAEHIVGATQSDVALWPGVDDIGQLLAGNGEQGVSLLNCVCLAL